MRETREFNLPIERKGENEIKIEKLFKMFMNKASREGIREGYRWFSWMYTYLPENERKAMKNRIEKSKEMDIDGVPKEKKEGLLKLLENFSKKRDNDFKKIYSEETPLERKKTLMENQASLEMVEESFKRWKERENKFKEASTEERLKMWLEEMDSRETDRRKGLLGNWRKRKEGKKDDRGMTEV